MEKKIHRQLVNIPTCHLYSHPENPRKDVGDVEELAKSIKANGLMQNLTVIPKIPGTPVSLTADYIVLIGHRRLAAAKLAGLTELPCKIIEGLSEREQISTMLEENMQRTDLTIYEQAKGFQMMLDLGETMESIKEKTGFSETTIRRRLNIAKLDQKKLKAAEDSFQISLKDLALLEGIKDIKTRNRVLSECKAHSDFAWKVSSAIRDEKRQEAEKEVLKLITATGLDIKKAPENFSRWSGNVVTLKEFDLDGKIPKKSFKWDKEPPEGAELVYQTYFSSVFICCQGKEAKKVESPQEKKRKEINKKRKQINGVLKDFAKDRRVFVLDMIAGKTEKAEDSQKIIDECFKALLAMSSSVSMHDLEGYLANKNFWDLSEEEKKECEEKAKKLTLEQQLVILLDSRVGHDTVICNYDGKYQCHGPEYSTSPYYLQKLIDILGEYGFKIESQEVKEILDGTSELYVPEG